MANICINLERLTLWQIHDVALSVLMRLHIVDTMRNSVGVQLRASSSFHALACRLKRSFERTLLIRTHQVDVFSQHPPPPVITDLSLCTFPPRLCSHIAAHSGPFTTKKLTRVRARVQTHSVQSDRFIPTMLCVQLLIPQHPPPILTQATSDKDDTLETLFCCEFFYCFPRAR